MVVLDNSAVLNRQKVPLPKISLPNAVGLTALAIVIASWAVAVNNGYPTVPLNDLRILYGLFGQSDPL